MPLPVDPPAKKAKKMTKEESLPEAAAPLGDVNMDKDSSLILRTPTLTSLVRMDLLMGQV